MTLVAYGYGLDVFGNAASNIMVEVEVISSTESIEVFLEPDIEVEVECL